MNPEALVAALEDVAERMDVDVRTDAVEDGGMMTLRGHHIIVVPEDAPAPVKIDVLGAALSRLSLDDIFILPEVREVIEGYRPAEDG